MTFRHLMLLFTSAIVWQASAQTGPAADTSGNGMLQGNYYFRQVVYSTDSNGNITRATALYGTLAFDGNGHYTVNAQEADSQTSGGQPGPFTASGQTLAYAIGSNGLGYLDNPLFSGEQVVGLVGRGLFVGSSTEGQVNDVFWAVQAGSSPVTNATLTGSYWVGYMNLPAGDPTSGTTDAFFQMNANGNGGLTGTINATGYVGTSSNSTSQSISNATYSFTNGTGTLAFPASGALISGNKVIYVSPDGNFVIGGSPNGYDLFAAVRSATGSLGGSSFKGLYAISGTDEDLSGSSGVLGSLDTYYGSLSATGAGTIIRHDRLAPFDASAYNYTFDDYYTNFNSNGSYHDDLTGFQYAVGANGIGFVGVGDGPYPGIVFGVQAPAYSGPGVYLNPTGVVNAASSAPFTTGVAPGELITLYGTNLASSTTVASAPFPTQLGNVSVSINNRPAPIYYVSPTQVSVIVPYQTELTFANIQLTNGTASNKVQVFVNNTMPGVFSVPPGGVGAAAVLHADYSLVSASNPAKVGETLQVFLTGLGTVTPPISDGAAGPTNPLSYADVFNNNNLLVWIDGIQGTVTYGGLAPGLSGLYQINVTIPSGVSSGQDVYLGIDTPDSYAEQVTIRMQ